MKAFITGVNGFTGSHLAKRLRDRGYEVKGLVRKSSDLSRLQNCEIELVYGDICDRDVLEKALKDVDLVFHLAAYVELGLVDEAKMERVNVEGTRAILEVAKASKIAKMIYCSTIGVYGDTGGKIVNETFERQQKNFSSAYDRTKYQAQQLVNEFHQQGLPIISLMPAGILGPDDPHFGPILNLFCQGKLKFWVGGDRLTGIVHVDDLAEAMILAAEKSQLGEHYIISTGELKTREMFALLGQKMEIPSPTDLPEFLVRIIGNILDLVGRLFSWNPPIGKERVHYLYDRCVRIDGSKAREKLGWQPRSLTETLQDSIQSSVG
ncbi:MAG: NAD-dependent epimerase/dehydratase family protein [Cyanobacteria bacterium P01_E01_bin.42]